MAESSAADNENKFNVPHTAYPALQMLKTGNRKECPVLPHLVFTHTHTAQHH